MKTPPLEFHAPRTVEEVLALLVEHGDEAKILAGGQSLVPMLAMRLARPAHLVDVNGVDGLAGIRDEGDSVVFGATTRERHAEVSPLVAREIPAMAAPRRPRLHPQPGHRRREHRPRRRVGRAPGGGGAHRGDDGGAR
jgi:carbon-monoxide dehydrogenase medium subunit